MCVLSAVSERGCGAEDTDLEAPIVFGDFVCEVDLFPLAQELPELRPVIHTQVVTYEVSV